MRLESTIDFVSAALTGLLALAATLQARRHLDRWAFVAGMLALAIERFYNGLLIGTVLPERMYHWELGRLTASAFVPGAWLLFSLTFARGNAREFTRRWRPVLLAAFLLPPATVFFFRPAVIVSTFAVPEVNHLIFRLGAAGTVLQLIQLLTAILILMNLERTFRASVGTVRWRVKFMLMGVGVLFLVRLYTTSQALLFRAIDPSLGILSAGTLLVAGLLMLRSLLRSGHFNLDVYPSHSVLQGSMTVLLAGLYLLIVGVFAKIVEYLGGDSTFALKTLVVLIFVILLAVLLQSDQVQQKIRRFISRHFQRPLYDYRTVWRKFTEETATRFEQTEFCRAVVKLIAEIFQSLSVTVWVVDERHGELVPAASTFLTDHQMRDLRPGAAGTSTVLQALQTQAEPVDIDHRTEEWATILRHCQPDEFRQGGTRIAVPILSGHEVLAVILLGDRVGGTSFTLQDFELLKSIADQVASSLLNVRLSQRLLQAREHEAFQTMATFFVHDLKNAASTLNLMLQNLPDHFDDPAFREDALRGVAKSVARINHMISRLGQLQHGLKLTLAETDLNTVVQDAIGTCGEEKAFLIETRLDPLPQLDLDREKFTSVVTNLILNARDACIHSGRLLLTTSRNQNWAVLEATDNGRGMSPEFIKGSLFRPFQTTKPNGLGIGLFQSKMIIEAHGGRMEVESQPGQGTTFRIFLPVKA